MIYNPAWDLIRQIEPEDRFGRRQRDGYQLERTSRMTPEEREEFYKTGPTRDNVVKKYAWAIPAPESIEWLVSVLDGRAVVEIGAGTGYWAWMLKQHGVDVNAYDLHPPLEGFNDYHSPRRTEMAGYSNEERQKHYDHWKAWDDLAEMMNETAGAAPIPRRPYQPLPDVEERKVLYGAPGEEYHPVTQGNWSVLNSPENAGRVLLLCWPPYDDSMAYETLKAFPGDTLVYIGEGHGGCTGDDAFFELLAAEWDGQEGGPLEQWYGINDWMTLYTRRPR